MALSLLAATSAWVSPVVPVSNSRSTVVMQVRPNFDRRDRFDRRFDDRRFDGRVTPTFNGRRGRGGGTFDQLLAENRDDGFFDGPRDFEPRRDRRDFRGPQRFDDRRFYGDDLYGGGVANTVLDITAIAGVAAILYAVLTAPIIAKAKSVSVLVGLLFIASGGSLAVSAALDKGTALTFPWQQGRYDGYFETEGVYSLCRHPIYAGLITSCIGLDFLSASPERLLTRVLLTAGLATVLSFKADREEFEIERRNPRAYADYASVTPRFYPDPIDLWTELRIRGSESTLGGFLSTGVVIALLSFAFMPKGKF